MAPKIITILLVLGILFCLGTGLYKMLGKKNGQKSEQAVAKALTYRIAISFTLFLFLIIGFFTGWIHPHGIS